MTHVMLVAVHVVAFLAFLAIWVQNASADANKEQVLIDEKTCIKVYRNPSTASCQFGTDSCQRECSPRSYWLHSYSNRTGPFMLKTIRKCYATNHHCQDCQRKPSRVYVFSGSKYQMGVDVGKCSGVCSGGSAEGSGEEGETVGGGAGVTAAKACLPTQTRMDAFQGPNGYVTMEIIENCSCVPQACYRANYFRSVSTFVDNKRQEELVNTGKCIGSCSGITIGSRCVQYSLNGMCTWFLPGTPGKCRPTAGSTYHYTDISGTNKTLPIVEKCGCTTA